MFYNWKILKTSKGDDRKISELENTLKIINKKYKYLPKINFAGKCEYFIKLNTDEIVFT
jgi:hypothetical protein